MRTLYLFFSAKHSSVPDT